MLPVLHEDFSELNGDLEVSFKNQSKIEKWIHYVVKIYRHRMLCVRYLFRTPIRRYILINYLTIIFPAICRHLLVFVFLFKKIRWSIRVSIHVKLNKNHDSLFRFFQKMFLFIMYFLPLDQQEWRIKFDVSALLPENDERRTLISCWF